MFLQGFVCDQAQPSLVASAAASTSVSASAPSPLPSPATAHFTRGLPAGLFASPPASPPYESSAPNAFDSNLFTTCRNLQAALLSTAPASAPTPASASAVPSFPLTPPKQQRYHHLEQLTPPLTHASTPLKLRLRARKAAGTTSATTTTEDDASTNASTRRRIVRRTTPASGPNKRRRSVSDDHDSGNDGDQTNTAVERWDDDMYPPPSLAPYPFSNLSPPLAQAPGLLSAPFLQPIRQPSQEDLRAAFAAVPTTPTIPTSPTTPPRPQTPRRARIAPEALPLGLARADFHTLHSDGIPDDSSRCEAEAEVEADGESWTSEDDRMLVELVLEKLRLSKTDWQDCARSLGKKDRHSVGRRWKSLMLSDDVGLRPGARSSRRSRIHGTWR